MVLGGASPYHPPITQPSPTRRTLLDQKALTCDFMPGLDWRRRPRTVSTTCAMWSLLLNPELIALIVITGVQYTRLQINLLHLRTYAGLRRRR